jgi:hypothetical protein
MRSEADWFAPKRYGIGPGIPLRWQGWALLTGYLAIVFALVFTLEHRPIQLIAALIPPTVAFLVICARMTRGGWRWRWGEEE